MSNLIFPLVSGNTEMHEIEGRNPKVIFRRGLLLGVMW